MPSPVNWETFDRNLGELRTEIGTGFSTVHKKVDKLSSTVNTVSGRLIAVETKMQGLATREEMKDTISGAVKAHTDSCDRLDEEPTSKVETTPRQSVPPKRTLWGLDPNTASLIRWIIGIIFVGGAAAGGGAGLTQLIAP